MTGSAGAEARPSACGLVLVLGLVLALATGGCSTPAPGTPSMPAPPGASGSPGATGAPVAPATLPGPAPAPPPQPGHGLDSERAWLQSWFSGTPVTIALGRNGDVSVDVPIDFCFEAGRSAIKPALAAVLDKVGQSLRRSGAKLVLIAAAGDSPQPTPLAVERARAVRKHLLSRGVPGAQLTSGEGGSAAAVQLRMAY